MTAFDYTKERERRRRQRTRERLVGLEETRKRTVKAVHPNSMAARKWGRTFWETSG